MLLSRDAGLALVFVGLGVLLEDYLANEVVAVLFVLAGLGVIVAARREVAPAAP